ncbi:MAG: PEGA domain-containing protein [Nitrospirota bacterium]|nr:PEGA domain-containing protein [Nitrospirota bacterium]
MFKRLLSFVLAGSASLLLFACGGEKMALEVKAKMDGQPVAKAAVTVDGVQEGMTGEDGMFGKILTKKPGAEVEIAVTKEQPGYRIKPWKTSVLMKLPKKGIVEKYVLDADLVAERFVTIVALEKGAPVADAAVLAEGKEIGKTDAKGEFQYSYQTLPKGGADLAVKKPGYGSWKKTGELVPGEHIEAILSKRARVTVTALMEEYGQAGGLAGLSVSIDKRVIGKTDAKGSVTYSYDGEPGKKVQLAISAPGYIPESWKTKISLDGEIDIQRYFTPTTARPIRTGIYRVTGNTPNVDLKEVVAQTEDALTAQLFKYSCFREVPSKTLHAEVKAARVKIDKITAKGWRETPLKKKVDMIVMGSVAKDDQGFLVEVKFITSGGKIVHSQLARAKREKDIAGAAKDIANAVIAKFPFEGTVVGIDGDRYRINLGKSGYKIAKNMEFNLLAPKTDGTGKVTGYRDAGRLRIKKVDDAHSFAEADDLKKGEKVSVGDRVVRLAAREDDDGKDVAILSTKGGLPPDVSPLAGVNIYLNEEWVSTTNADGKAEVPVRLGKKYDLVLYRHGYQQVSDKLRVEKSRDVKEYSLTVNNAVFKADSSPQGAEVFVDGEKLGRTPMTEGKPVTLGFHTVRLTVGGDYRDWEEVVEFATKTEDRTAGRAIVLYKDFLKIGERAEKNNDVDGAIAAYAATQKDHPDYSDAHHRLAQLYLDEKNDYDAAIREFEKVLSLPENQQLIFKQYSVAFTNLGHAYYERGNALVQRDRDGSAQSFAKAIQTLQKAKENTRFFPTERYDEAVHDTYYYTALSYHKLYLLTKKSLLLNNANQAWQEYFDFFPAALENDGSFKQSREAGQKYWDQIKKQM